jgi:hypothetical protein
VALGLLVDETDDEDDVDLVRRLGMTAAAGLVGALRFDPTLPEDSLAECSVIAFNSFWKTG